MDITVRQCERRWLRRRVASDRGEPFSQLPEDQPSIRSSHACRAGAVLCKYGPTEGRLAEVPSRPVSVLGKIRRGHLVFTPKQPSG